MRKRSMIHLISILLMLLAMTSACFASPRTYEKDWSYFWEKLEESYPLFPYMQKIGVDVSKVRNDSWDEIQTCGDDTSFLRIMRKVSAKMQGLNHLAILNEKDLSNISPYLEVSPMERRELYTEVGVVSSENANATSLLRCSYIPDLKTILITFPSFSIESMNMDKETLSTFLKKHLDATSIIFDVSSNRGGYGLYWAEVILPLFGGTWHDSVNLFFRNKEAVISQFIPGFFDESAILSTIELERRPIFVDELDLKWYLESSMDFSFGEGILPGAKRYILTSSQTYSAADSFAAFARNTGWATLVGEPTGGDGYGDNLYYLLPNTGYVLRFSPFITENTSGMANNFYGTLPHILKSRKKTTLNTCLDIIKNTL